MPSSYQTMIDQDSCSPGARKQGVFLLPRCNIHAVSLELRDMESYERESTSYRFAPTDEEILVHYLYNKINNLPLSTGMVIECDLYDKENNAWMKYFEQTGENELYFFTKLRRKTERGSRVERVTSFGTWRAQMDSIINFEGDKEQHIGSKRNFTFVPKEGSGVKGRWVMHEYRLDGLFRNPTNDIDDYVLCRVKKKPSNEEPNQQMTDVPTVRKDVPTEVQAPNTACNTKEDLEKFLLDSTLDDDDETDFDFNLGITPEELEENIARFVNYFQY